MRQKTVARGTKNPVTTADAVLYANEQLDHGGPLMRHEECVYGIVISSCRKQAKTIVKAHRPVIRRATKEYIRAKHSNDDKIKMDARERLEAQLTPIVRSALLSSPSEPVPSFVFHSTATSRVTHHVTLELERRIFIGLLPREIAARIFLAIRPFIVSIAKKYFGSHAAQQATMDDMIHYGMLGVPEALWRYNSRRGTRFIIYAKNWVRRRITTRFFQENFGSHGRITRQTHCAIQTIKNAIVQFREANDRDPTIDELARVTKFSTKKIQELFPLLHESRMLRFQELEDKPADHDRMLLEETEIMTDRERPSPEMALIIAEELKRYKTMSELLLETTRAGTSKRTRAILQKIVQGRLLQDGTATHLKLIGRAFHISKQAVQRHEKELIERALQRLHEVGHKIDETGLRHLGATVARLEELVSLC